MWTSKSTTTLLKTEEIGNIIGSIWSYYNKERVIVLFKSLKYLHPHLDDSTEGATDMSTALQK